MACGIQEINADICYERDVREETVGKALTSIPRQYELCVPGSGKSLPSK